jgi:tetratricopeptide (TPR) repeat protein
MRREVERLASGIPVFQRGVAQVRSGNSQAALDSFDAFVRQTRYAGKELLNNVGLAYLQMGTRALVACGSREPARFRISTWVDERAPLTGLRLRGRPLESCAQAVEARRHLETAVLRLRDAVGGDPTYLPAYLNLIAVLVVSGRVPEAYAQASVLGAGRVGRLVESLPPSDARRVAASNASSVCEYLTRRALGASTEVPIAALEALVAANPGDPAVLFNFARTLQESGRAEEAQDAWSRYLRLDPRGPFSAAALDALEALGRGPDAPLEATVTGKDSS